MFEKLKYRYGNFRLKRDYRKHGNNAIACGLKQAKSIGIIYNATNDSDYDIVLQFAQEIKNRGPHVCLLGSIDKKETEFTRIQQPDNYFHYISNLNWYFKPINQNIDRFTSKNYDILIDLNLSQSLPTKFILAESKTSFKIGRFTTELPNEYDLMIDISEGSIKDQDISILKFFTKQVLIYLEMIKT